MRSSAPLVFCTWLLEGIQFSWGWAGSTEPFFYLSWNPRGGNPITISLIYVGWHFSSPAIRVPPISFPRVKIPNQEFIAPAFPVWTFLDVFRWRRRKFTSSTMVNVHVLGPKKHTSTFLSARFQHIQFLKAPKYPRIPSFAWKGQPWGNILENRSLFVLMGSFFWFEEFCQACFENIDRSYFSQWGKYCLC